MCGAPTPKPLCSCLRGGYTIPEPSPWPPPRITEPGSTTGDCDLVFSNKSSKKVYWWQFAHCYCRFQRRYIDFECTNLVSQFGSGEIMVSMIIPNCRLWLGSFCVADLVEHTVADYTVTHSEMAQLVHRMWKGLLRYRVLINRAPALMLFRTAEQWLNTALATRIL